MPQPSHGISPPRRHPSERATCTIARREVLPSVTQRGEWGMFTVRKRSTALACALTSASALLFASSAHAVVPSSIAALGDSYSAAAVQRRAVLGRRRSCLGELLVDGHEQRASTATTCACARSNPKINGRVLHLRRLGPQGLRPRAARRNQAVAQRVGVRDGHARPQRLLCRESEAAMTPVTTFRSQFAARHRRARARAAERAHPRHEHPRRRALARAATRTSPRPAAAWAVAAGLQRWRSPTR